MTPFLKSIAEAYLKQEIDNLIDTCFIFPNRRSALYFGDYLQTAAQRENIRIVMPALTTIVDFTEGFTKDSIPAERMELIFILYRVYSEVIKNNTTNSSSDSIDFNKFVLWADVLLNDFDDVDHALADSEKIFSNVKNLKEISANFLSAEQIEVLGHYFDTDRLKSEVEAFWKHINTPSSDNGSVSDGFVLIWQVISEIYTRFYDELTQKGLHTPGMSARNAANAVKHMSADDFPYRRYVFVGFDYLTNAQLMIMTRMSDLTINGSPLADFYWDLSSPVFAASNKPDGINTVMKYADRFPSIYDCIEPIKAFPPIKIMGIPSRIGQAKAIGNILGRNCESASPSENACLRKTAIVLTEENLLSPLLNSLPDSIKDINITMGYKLRNTAAAGLLRDITIMQKHASKGVAEPTFYYDDVIRVLSNPVVQMCMPDICVRSILEIQRKHIFSVPVSFFSVGERNELKELFTYIPNQVSKEDSVKYQYGIINKLTELIRYKERNYINSEISSDEDADETERIALNSTSDNAISVQLAFLEAYKNAILQLETLFNKYLPSDTLIDKNTIFAISDRIIQREILVFEGLPLRGLQIMGVLEARSLDFDTIIIPSLNENVFPRARFNASFIPPVIRRAYGLTTPDDEENAYTYRFYRMISRASHVILLYDARSTGRRTQPSRYIHQLCNLYKPEYLQRETYSYTLKNPEDTEFVVNKTPEIMSRLNRYIVSGSDSSYLSASSIERYIECPMSFYLSYIAGFSREDRPTEWIDESMFGTIVHSVLEETYNTFLSKSPNGALISEDAIDELLKTTNTLIDRLTTRAINVNYQNLPPEQADTPLTGQNRLIADIIAQYAKNIFRRDKALAPFTYLHGEWGAEHNGPLTLSDRSGNSITFNFTCRIDRIDKVADEHGNLRLRIVDYKSGADNPEAASLSDVMENHQNKALIQLLLYAQAYASRTGYDKPIQPMIYPIRRLILNQIESYKIGESPADIVNVADIDIKQPQKKNGKWKILDYRDYAPEMNALLIPRLKELFNAEIPFRCADNDSACHFCRFTAICRKNNQSF